MNSNYTDQLSYSNSSSEDDDWSNACDDEEKESFFESRNRTSSSHQNNTPSSSSSSSSSVSTNSMISKCIIHLDIDCFYCQCEEIQNPTLASKPLAIGQKHIIVTANYIARRRWGIKKLMSRKEAKAICPVLTIVEGSDLEKYRMASRDVYVEFRNAVKELGTGTRNDGSHDGNGGNGGDNAAKKGCMDEMFADVTNAVEEQRLIYHHDKNTTTRNGKGQIDINANNKDLCINLPPKTFVYGEDEKSSIVRISEDQSGVEAVIRSNQTAAASTTSTTTTHTTSQLSSIVWGSYEEQKQCEERLKLGIIIANQIRERIRIKTKYSCTVGVSVSPMLAKLACDFKKPDANNLLYPWRAKPIIENMPLRRIPDLGSRTLKVLISCLHQYNNNHERNKCHDDTNHGFWKCKDLLQVPRNAILSCLSNHDSFQKNCEQQCDLLLNRCRGIDTMPIIDDGGELSKTISVEDSFIRGSIISFETVVEKLHSLYRRLLRLLEQRKQYSSKPLLSFPKAIRVSVRIVDRSLENIGRRPFRTISKQTNFNGKLLMEETDVSQQELMLKSSALPLLSSLLQDGKILQLNVTRLNIAVISFADIGISTESDKVSKSQRNLSTYFAQSNNATMVRVGTTSSSSSSMLKKKRPISFQTSSEMPKRSKQKLQVSQSSCSSEERIPIPHGIDPSVFASLPLDIANEVLKNPSVHTSLFNMSNKKKKEGKMKGIASFFEKRRS